MENSKKSQAGTGFKSSNQKPTVANVEVQIEESIQPIHHGLNLRHYRKAQGFSQEYVALQIGCSQQKYSDLERQEFIDEEILQKIADLFGLTIKWLKDIPAIKSSTIYYQDGSGIYFSNVGAATHTINKPIEEVVASYDKILKRVDDEIERLRIELNEEKKRTEFEKDKREELLIRLSEFAMKKN